MPEITNEEIRPIKRIVDEYSFEIESTELYSAYEKGGFLFGVNFPKNQKYTSFLEQLNNPTLEDDENQFLNHISFCILLEMHSL